jgi:predicted O-methyltransferase YrrM
MYSKWQLAAKYLNYYLTASNGKGHGMHSPFVFQFITGLLNDKTIYPEYDSIENLRSRLLKDDTVLRVEEMGAGSSVSKTNQRSIASIARNAAKPRKFGQLLYRVAKAYQPRTILEFGTSLGVTTAYLSSGNPNAHIITMEGAKEVAAVASQHFKYLGLKNIDLREGNFDDLLTGILNGLEHLDLVFIDGNHRREPTERYFIELLRKVNNDSILIFDDIHWSKGMEEAWETIKRHPSVRCTVDLFFIGVVFFRQEFKEKQHFSIRF